MLLKSAIAVEEPEADVYHLVSSHPGLREPS